MRGGKRTGAGRPQGNRQHKICIKIQEDTKYMLENVPNKSAYIDFLIRKDLANKMYHLDLKKDITKKDST